MVAKPGGIDFFRGRGEDQVDGQRCKQREIGLHVARIFLVIFLRAELLGVYEDRDDDDIAFAAAALHEA